MHSVHETASPYILVTPIQLMRPGIESCTVGDFTLTSRPIFFLGRCSSLIVHVYNGMQVPWSCNGIHHKHDTHFAL